MRWKIGHGIWAVLAVIVRVLSADIVVCWFASVYASVAIRAGSMFGVKSLVIVGGVDAAKDAALDYGIWLSPWRARLVRYAFRNADRILVVDPSLKEEAIRLADYDGRNIVYCPTGYDIDFWKPMGDKERQVLTVAIVRDERTMHVKGLDLLVEAARLLPEVPFSIVGVEQGIVGRLRPPANVTFLEPIERRALLHHYQRAKVYCQPSRREGLPNALCEAMACACIPVATDVNGNPTALGDTGIVVAPDDSCALADAIRRALDSDEREGLKARARIVALFPRHKREVDLVQHIRALCR